MIPPIVHSLEPITLVGGGPVDPADLALALTMSGGVVAVDGGASPLLAAGQVPQAVIGDFDSLPTGARAQWPPGIFHHIGEQDSTDFEKALVRVEAPVLIGVGFLGARLDHALAALHALMRFAHRPCVLLGEQELLFLAPPCLQIMAEAGATVSLFPLCRVTGRSTGLEWPIDGLDLAPGVRVGTSNRASGGTVTLDIDKAGLVVMLPKSCLADVMQALCQGPVSRQLPHDGAARWPVRAT